MNAVVLTVKASYVASTKVGLTFVGEIRKITLLLSLQYPRQGAAANNIPIVVWKMKAPEKKPLVRREKPEEARAKVKRGSQKKSIAPIKALSEFQSPSDSV